MSPNGANDIDRWLKNMLSIRINMLSIQIDISSVTRLNIVLISEIGAVCSPPHLSVDTYTSYTSTEKKKKLAGRKLAIEMTSANSHFCIVCTTRRADNSRPNECEKKKPSETNEV